MEEIPDPITQQANKGQITAPLSKEETAIICLWLEMQLTILRPPTVSTGSIEDTPRPDIVPAPLVGDRVRITNQVSLPFSLGQRTTGDKMGVIGRIT
jgi:hypothetical protein